MKSQENIGLAEIAWLQGFRMVIWWIVLSFSGCATQQLNQRESSAALGVRNPSVCRLEFNEVPAKGEPDSDISHRHEVRAAVGLTGLIGGIYAEALGVHQVLASQPEVRQTDPGPDTKGCIN